MFSMDPAISRDLPVYRANGTVIASDVETLYTDPPARSLIIIDPDFDGYMAELARGLATVLSRGATGPQRIAVVCNADVLDEAELGGLSTEGKNLRAFTRSQMAEALAWLKN